MQIARFFLDRPVVANLLTLIIIVVGVSAIFQARRAMYPPVNFDIIKITTTYPGASVEEIETKVTEKIEEEILKVSNIEKIKSSSIEGMSLIYVFIDPDADNIDRVKDEVQQAVDRVPDLPRDMDDRPLLDEMRSSNIVIVEVAVHGASERDRRTAAKALKDEFIEIPGVKSVELSGYRRREVIILAETAALQDKYIALSDIVQALQARNIRTSAGNLEGASEQKIVTFSEFEDPADVANVVVRSNFTGQQVLIGEIATIRDGFAEHDILPRTAGQPSINLLVRAQASGDVITISENVVTMIEEFRERAPPGVEIGIVTDFSRYAKSLLDIVTNNAVIGFCFVLITLSLLLNRYIALWTAAGIPLAIFGAFALFPFFGIDINFLTLLTFILVLGMLVDDAIVIAERISWHREQGMDPHAASLQGLRDVFWPVCATIATTILAFLPIFAMQGITGKFMWTMPVVIILVLGMSLLEASLLLPCHIAQVPRTPPKRVKWFLWTQGKAEQLIRMGVRYRGRTLAVFAGFLVIAGILLTTHMKFMLFPYDDIDMFYVIAELPAGTPLETTARRLEAVENIVATIPETELINFSTRVGTHDTDVYGASSGRHENWGMVSVYLLPAIERDRASEEIMGELEAELSKLEGFDRLYLEKFNDGPPIGKPITVSVVSDIDSQRRGMANDILKLLQDTPGVLDLDMSEQTGIAELRMRPRHDRLAKSGVTVQQLSTVLRTAYAGVVATEITRNGEEIDFRVRLSDADRRDRSKLAQLYIPNRAQQLIAMGQLVETESSEGLDVMRHYNGRRSITITGDIDSNILTAWEINERIRDQFGPEAERNPTLRLIFGGEEQATQESMQSLFRAFGIALLGIYCVLVLLFQSFTLPFLIMSAIPFGLAGVVVVFFIADLPISFLATIGSLGLIGVLVNDSLIMVSHLQDLRKTKGELSIEEIIQGAKDRLRPVLLTTITTVCGLLPTIFGIGGYEPFVVPIVLAIAGGLIFATPITLILVPTIYALRQKLDG
jgi:multidrug efflux pump subunit AcrB